MPLMRCGHQLHQDSMGAVVKLTLERIAEIELRAREGLLPVWYNEVISLCAAARSWLEWNDVLVETRRDEPTGRSSLNESLARSGSDERRTLEGLEAASPQPEPHKPMTIRKIPDSPDTRHGGMVSPGEAKRGDAEWEDYERAQQGLPPLPSIYTSPAGEAEREDSLIACSYCGQLVSDRHTPGCPAASPARTEGDIVKLAADWAYAFSDGANREMSLNEIATVSGDDLAGDLQKIAAALAASQEEIEGWIKNSKHVQEKSLEIFKEREALRAEVEHLTKALKQREHDLNTYRNADLRSEVYTLRSELAAERALKNLTSASNDALRSELAECREKLDTTKALHVDIAALNACIAHLETERTALRADNDRLWGALNQYTACQHGSMNCSCTKIARAALNPKDAP